MSRFLGLSLGRVPVVLCQLLIDCHTDTPFHIDDGDEWPSSGVFIVGGEGGTEAQLTALSSTTYIVDADTDGDGIYDWDSGVLNWS